MKRKNNTSLILRIIILIGICGVAAFAALAIRLFRLQITDNSYYESKALEYQLSQTSLSASRGTIYDASGKILAMSASVENVFISPFEFRRDEQDVPLIAGGLSDILDVDYDSIIRMAGNVESQYQVVKKGVESAQAALVREFIEQNGLKGIYFEPDSRRYYPNNNLASQALGFVGDDNTGLYGIEQRYDSQLTGEGGRSVRLTTAKGSELMLDEYDDYYAARDGESITLTIDSTVQYYVEKHLEQAVADYDVQNGASCIAMHAKTGAVLGIANSPNFNPNSFLELPDAEMERLSEIEDEKEYAEAFFAAQLNGWRNRALTDTYEPGSVFKLITLAMALEENAVTPDDYFYCGGSMTVLGREEDDPLHCWNTDGHGYQTLNEAMQNSCNIMSAELALKVGAPAFYKYIESFGLFSQTGLDSETEGRGLWWDEAVFTDRNNHSQLASASFGQTFKVTPIQMITAAAAAVNGGYLMKPYMIENIRDSEGDITMAAMPTVVRQVISEETSRKVRTILEGVVNDGTGRNAQVRGYAVGGKTGTSENIEQLTAVGAEETPESEKDYIVSFLGFAPADDPEIVILLLLDTPSNETGLYISGGGMAAPVAGKMLSDILPLGLGINPEYKEEDLLEINLDMPRLLGRSVSDASEMAAELGFTVEVVGTGESVTNQLPAPNAYIASGSKVVIYAGMDAAKEPVIVPDLSGMLYTDAKNALESRGLFIKSSGASRADSRTMVHVQSVPAGQETEYGSVIEVTLISRDAVERD